MCAASFGSAEHVRRRPCRRGNAAGSGAPCVKTALRRLHAAPRSVTSATGRQRGTRSKIADRSSRSIAATAPVPCDAGVSGDGGVQGNLARSRLRSEFYRHTRRILDAGVAMAARVRCGRPCRGRAQVCPLLSRRERSHRIGSSRVCCKHMRDIRRLGAALPHSVGHGGPFRPRWIWTCSCETTSLVSPSHTLHHDSYRSGSCPKAAFARDFAPPRRTTGGRAAPGI